MNTLRKLKEVGEMAVIYSINFRRAGWGMTFYENERGPYPESHLDERWRQGLVTYAYYSTFGKMVAAEYSRLKRKARRDNA